MLDSAQLHPLVPSTARNLADLGSGAGFPGLVLVILGVPGVELVEADSRRCALLREAARITEAKVTIRPCRIEAVAPHPVAMHASGQRAVRQLDAARAIQADARLTTLGYIQAVIIGSAQILALLAGISRDGVAMVTGMFRGLSRQDAARFSFLLSTPVIFAAGFLKVGDLFGPLGNGIRGQVLVASILSGVGAYVSVRFLIRYFQTRTLTPFAVYCVVFGLASAVYLSVK